jgi:hypothetical protein
MGNLHRFALLVFITEDEHFHTYFERVLPLAAYPELTLGKGAWVASVSKVPRRAVTIQPIENSIDPFTSTILDIVSFASGITFVASHCPATIAIVDVRDRGLSIRATAKVVGAPATVQKVKAASSEKDTQHAF